MFHFDTIPEGLLVTVIGVAIVFIGLVILIGLIKIMQVLTSGLGQKKEVKPAPAPAPVAVLTPVVEEAPAAASNDEELIAVISAAIAAMMDDGSRFTVRRIRRISNASAWNKAGREEQIYSRF